MDPYSVLGVNRNASDDEVKKAYRELVKKYHPDRYTDEAMKNLADDKLKQINAAYDEIQRMRQNKGGSSNSAYGGASGFGGQSYGNYGGYNASYSGNAKYQAVYQRIQMNDVAGAESILSSITPQDAEWHYLKGVINLKRGWYEGARQEFASAHSMDPSNQQYAQAFNQTNNMGNANAYNDFYGGGSNTGDCSICDICATMACLNMCCNCR